MLHRKESIRAIVEEGKRSILIAYGAGQQWGCRLNGASDLPFWSDTFCAGSSPLREWIRYSEKIGAPAPWLYDWSKNLHWLNNPEFRELYDRGTYRVCWSRSEWNNAQIVEALRAGHDCAVVFHELGAFCGHSAAAQRLPETYTLDGTRFSVLDGDWSDIRGWTDPPKGRSKLGRIIGLRLKAATRQQRQTMIDSGFSLPAFP